MAQFALLDDKGNCLLVAEAADKLDVELWAFRNGYATARIEEYHAEQDRKALVEALTNAGHAREAAEAAAQAGGPYQWQGVKRVTVPRQEPKLIKPAASAAPLASAGLRRLRSELEAQKGHSRLVDLRERGSIVPLEEGER